MAIETEKKYALTAERYLEIIASLEESQARFTGEDFEINEIYGGGILDEKAAILRIRKIGSKTILTYKKRIDNNSGVKEQIEHESEVSNREAIEEIIEALGFSKRIIYEKRRKTFKFKGLEIVMDELPFGLYMEIEGSLTGIKEAEMILGLEGLETEHLTYPNLTAKLGKKEGEIFIAKFEKRDYNLQETR